MLTQQTKVLTGLINLHGKRSSVLYFLSVLVVPPGYRPGSIGYTFQGQQFSFQHHHHPIFDPGLPPKRGWPDLPRSNSNLSNSQKILSSRLFYRPMSGNSC